MNLKSVLAATAILVASPLATPYAGQSGHPNEPSKNMPMSAGEGAATMMGDIEGHKKKMMQQMEKIRNTQDPELRDKLIEEHMQSMQKGMSMMGGMHAGQQEEMASDMPSRMGDMEQRMDMMQMMMDQMMQSQMEIQKTRKLHDHRKIHK